MLEITKQFQDRYSDLFKQDLSDLSEALKSSNNQIPIEIITIWIGID